MVVEVREGSGLLLGMLFQVALGIRLLLAVVALVQVAVGRPSGTMVTTVFLTPLRLLVAELARQIRILQGPLAALAVVVLAIMLLLAALELVGKGTMVVRRLDFLRVKVAEAEGQVLLALMAVRQAVWVPEAMARRSTLALVLLRMPEVEAAERQTLAAEELVALVVVA